MGAVRTQFNPRGSRSRRSTWGAIVAPPIAARCQFVAAWIADPDFYRSRPHLRTLGLPDPVAIEGRGRPDRQSGPIVVRETL
jgi:hypothetical protein